jgi:hypothetical protein
MLDQNKFPTPEQEIMWIEEALVELLREIVRQEKRGNRPPSRHGFVAYDINELGSRSSLYWEVSHVVDHPVREACALAIRRLGQRLHEMSADMMEVHDHVVERTRKYQDYWSMLLDKRWNGVGDWHA